MKSPTPALLAITLLAAIGRLTPLYAQAPASPECAVWSNSENRCLQLAPTPEERAVCVVWSQAENRCLDAPKATPRSPAAPASAAIRNDPARQAAIAALRAVESVLTGGANIGEFKKYYLEAKVKVDALPRIPENLPIVEVGGIFADASTLFTDALVHEISAAEVLRLQQKYADDSNLMNFFARLPASGLGPISTHLDQEIATNWMRASAQALLGYAALKLSTMQ